ncbi:hypothetical protein IGI71_003269 [Enterococcus sp. DIV1279b]|uniref:ABC transporter permease n=1 Tax=Enterococcus sp. DIV1279b TaxID=2774663 RepID=UPI003D2FEF19
MKRTLFFVTNLIFLIATLINAFSFFYFYYQSNLDFVSNNFTSKESVRLIVNNNLASETWGNLLGDQKKMLVVKNLESNFYYKAIYTNYDWYLPLSEGRNFVKEDFYDGKNRAIVGKELASKNKNNVNIEGKNYEIIGVLDGAYSKNLNKTALINIDSLEGTQTQGVYQINSNESAMEKVKKHLINDISAITYSDDTKIYNAKNTESNNNLLRYSFQILCLLGVGICIFFYLTLSQSTNYLKKIIGISRNTVLIEEIKQLLAVWLVESVLVLTILYFPFKKYIYDSIHSFTTNYISSQFLIICSAATLFILLFLRNWRKLDEI